MKIAFDAVTPGMSLAPGRGSMRMTLASLLMALSEDEHVNQYIVVEQKHLPLPGLIAANVQRKMLRVPRWRVARSLYQNTVYPLLINRVGADLLLATCNVVPVGVSVPTVVIMQSVQYFELPDAYGALRLRYLRAAARSAVDRAAAVVCMSRHSADVLERCTSVSRDKLHVIPHGLPPLSVPGAATTPAPEPFMVYVSSFYRFKNHQRLFEAYRLLRERYGIRHRLRIVGGDADVRTRELQTMVESLGIAAHVDFTGPVPHEEVVRHYRDAALSVFPSLYETFGYPPLEAMALGCPVVAARVTSIPEVVGPGGAELVNPYDVEDIARGVVAVLRNDAYRAALVESGRRRAKEFSWVKSASMMNALLRDVARKCNIEA